MKDTSLLSRALRAAELVQLHGLTQSQIAAAVGASQPQVSRILKGHGLKRSRVFEDVCLYAERYSHGVTAQAVCENEELISALMETWDGSANHARALAAVIRSLSALGVRHAGQDVVVEKGAA